MRKALPVLATLALLLALLAPPARANPTIQFTESYTGHDNTGPVLVTLGGIDFQAFKLFTDGTGTLSFSGFSSYNGPGTVTGSGGVIQVAISSVDLLTITDAYSVNSIGTFSLQGVATLPAPGGLALLGLPLLALAGLRRRATAG